MGHRSLSRRSRLRGIAAASWPAAAVLAALVLGGELTPLAAATAAVAAALLHWAVIARHHRSLVRLVDALDRLGAEDAEDAPPGRLRIASPLTGPRIGAALAAAMDGLRQRLRAARRRQRSLESLIAHLPTPVVAIDGDRRILHTGGGTEALFDGARAGGDLAALLRDPAVLEAADRVIETGGREEIDFTAGPGAQTALAARIVGLAAPAPDGVRAVIEVFDVTALRRAERARVDFVANASHELRTPLSVLLGCIETLRGAARGDRAARERFLAMMESQVGHMTRLVGDLLSLSRIELGEHRPPTDRVALLPVVERVADALQFAARARDVEIAVAGAPSAPDAIGDRDELTQLFQNLIDNAVKYSRSGGRVEIGIAPGRLENGAAAVTVAVRDQGEGIAEEHLGRLTERFYRIDSARSRELGGTGLGLAIVKHVVGRHRGRLRIASAVGVGSSFSVDLPAADAAVIKP